MQTRYDVVVYRKAWASVLTLVLSEPHKVSVTSTTLSTLEDFQDALARALSQVGKRFVRLIPYMPGEKTECYRCEVIAEEVGDPVKCPTCGSVPLEAIHTHTDEMPPGCEPDCVTLGCVPKPTRTVRDIRGVCSDSYEDGYGGDLGRSRL